MKKESYLENLVELKNRWIAEFKAANVRRKMLYVFGIPRAFVWCLYLTYQHNKMAEIAAEIVAKKFKK